MLKDNPKKIVTIFFLSLAVLGLGFLAYSRYFLNSDNDSENTLNSDPNQAENNLQNTPEELLEKFGEPPVIDSVSYSKDLDSSFKEMLEKEIEKVLGDIKNDQYNFSLWFDLGNLLKISGDLGKTRSAWEFAATLEPKNFEVYERLGTFYAYELKDYEKAKEAFSKAIENAPNQAQLYITFARFYAETLKDTVEAKKILNQGLKSLPGNQLLQEYLSKL